MNPNLIAQAIFEFYLKYADVEGEHDFVTEDKVYFKYYLSNSPTPEITVHEIYIDEIEQSKDFINNVEHVLEGILFDYYYLNE